MLCAVHSRDGKGMERTNGKKTGDRALPTTRPFLRGRTLRLLLAALAGIAGGILLLKSGRVPTELGVPPGWVATAGGAIFSAFLAFFLLMKLDQPGVLHHVVDGAIQFHVAGLLGEVFHQ